MQPCLCTWPQTQVSSSATPRLLFSFLSSKNNLLTTIVFGFVIENDILWSFTSVIIPILICLTCNYQTKQIFQQIGSLSFLDSIYYTNTRVISAHFENVHYPQLFQTVLIRCFEGRKTECVLEKFNMLHSFILVLKTH